MNIRQEILESMSSPGSLTGKLPGILLGMLHREASMHEPILDASSAVCIPGSGPTPVGYGPLAVLQFKRNESAAYRSIRVPETYGGSGQLHIHWTKCSDEKVLGHTVRWAVEYQITDAESVPANEFQGSWEILDEYRDHRTTLMAVMATASVAIPEVKAGDHIYMRIRALDPEDGTPIRCPSLVSVDMTWMSLHEAS